MLLVHHNALAAAASDAQISPRFHQVSEQILPKEIVQNFNISPTQVQQIQPPMLSNEQYANPYVLDYSSQANHQEQQNYQLPRFFNPYMTFKSEQIDERPPSNEQTDYQHYTNLSPTMDLKQPEDEPKAQQFQYTNSAIKQEPSVDILDMDAQKSVYPTNYGYLHPEPLPPVSSIYQGLNWMHQHPPPMHFPINENYQPNEIFSQIEDPVLEAFNRNQFAANQQTSPSLIEEYPIAVAPVAKKAVKEQTWQSNETRKPKTYNCTSCCKWFTSSGHLKRHFSTTLHQNAVRLSGQPDPAQLPTSTHHHPIQQSAQQVFKVPVHQLAGSSFNQQQPNFYQPIPEQNLQQQQQQFSPNQQVYYNSSFESVAPNRCDSSSLTSFEDDENEIPNDMNGQQGMSNYPQQLINFQENQMIPANLHKCIECDKVFNKSCYLTQHNRSFHNGLKPFKCQRCGKKFASHVELDVHFAKHNGDKPFKCELCPKQFHHKTDLRRHMCTHNGKPFSCEICAKGFIRNDHMLKHTEIHRRKSAQNLNKEFNKNGKALKRNLI